MSLAALLPQIATHRRRVLNVVSASAFPFTATLAFTSGQPTRFKANGTGLADTVSIILTGSLHGTPQTESMSVPVTAGQLKLSTKKWTTLTEVSSPTTTTGALTGRAITDTGMEIASETVLSSTLRCRLRRRRGAQGLVDAGNVLREEWMCYLTSAAVQTDDLLVIDNVTYEVHSVYPVHDARMRHHIEAHLHRL